MSRLSLNLPFIYTYSTRIKSYRGLLAYLALEVLPLVLAAGVTSTRNVINILLLYIFWFDLYEIGWRVEFGVSSFCGLWRGTAVPNTGKALDAPTQGAQGGVDQNGQIHKEGAVLDIAQVVVDVLVDRKGAIGAQLP